MENQEKIQDSLTEFDKTPSKDIPPILEDYLKTVAKTGKTVFPWCQLKTLFSQKLVQVMEVFNKDEPCERQNPLPNVENAKYMEMQNRILDAMQRFTSAPFTVQRLCELVTQPKKHYTKCDKFMRGIEKNVLVVSTVDPQGKKIVSESRVMVNGMDVNGVSRQDSGEDIPDFPGDVPLDWAASHAIWPTPGLGPFNSYPRGMGENGTQQQQDSEADKDSNEVFKFKTKDEAEVENSDSGSDNSDKVEKETTESAQENINTNNSNEAAECVTDSVKLPQASSLLKKLENKESEEVESNKCEKLETDTDSEKSPTQSDSNDTANIPKQASDEESIEAEPSDATSQEGNGCKDSEAVASMTDNAEADGRSAGAGGDGESMEAQSEGGEECSVEMGEDRTETLVESDSTTGAVVRSAPDDGEQPPEKKMKYTVKEDVEETKEQTSTESDAADTTDGGGDDGEQTIQSDLPESIQESCQDDDTMPFNPLTNQELAECDSSQSLTTLTNPKVDLELESSIQSAGHLAKIEEENDGEASSSNADTTNSEENADTTDSMEQSEESAEAESVGNFSEVSKSESTESEQHQQEQQQESTEDITDNETEEVQSTNSEQEGREEEEKPESEAMETDS